MRARSLSHPIMPRSPPLRSTAAPYVPMERAPLQPRVIRTVKRNCNLRALRAMIAHLTESFAMVPDPGYKMPQGYVDIAVDPFGSLIVYMSDVEQNDPKTRLLMLVLRDIHVMCLAVCGRIARTVNVSVDPYEVSWAVQVYLFIMRARCSCIKEADGIVYVDRPTLIALTQKALCRSTLTKHNAVTMFKGIAEAIAAL